MLLHVMSQSCGITTLAYKFLDLEMDNIFVHLQAFFRIVSFSALLTNVVPHVEVNALFVEPQVKTIEKCRTTFFANIVLQLEMDRFDMDV